MFDRYGLFVCIYGDLLGDALPKLGGRLIQILKHNTLRILIDQGQVGGKVIHQVILVFR